MDSKENKERNAKQTEVGKRNNERHKNQAVKTFLVISRSLIQ